MLMLMCRIDEDKKKQSSNLQKKNPNTLYKASTVFRTFKLRQTRNLLEHEQINGQSQQKKVEKKLSGFYFLFYLKFLAVSFYES